MILPHVEAKYHSSMPAILCVGTVVPVMGILSNGAPSDLAFTSSLPRGQPLQGHIVYRKHRGRYRTGPQNADRKSPIKSLLPSHNQDGIPDCAHHRPGTLLPASCVVVHAVAQGIEREEGSPAQNSGPRSAHHSFFQRQHGCSSGAFSPPVLGIHHESFQSLVA